MTAMKQLVRQNAKFRFLGTADDKKLNPDMCFFENVSINVRCAFSSFGVDVA